MKRGRKDHSDFYILLQSVKVLTMKGQKMPQIKLKRTQNELSAISPKQETFMLLNETTQGQIAYLSCKILENVWKSIVILQDVER